MTRGVVTASGWDDVDVHRVGQEQKRKRKRKEETVKRNERKASRPE